MAGCKPVSGLLFVSATFIVLYSYAVKMEAGRKPLTPTAAEVKDFSDTRQSPLSLCLSAERKAHNWTSHTSLSDLQDKEAKHCRGN